MQPALMTNFIGRVPIELQKIFLSTGHCFVIEFRSQSDNLKSFQEKKEEYMENDSLLGFLFDPVQQKAWIKRKGTSSGLIEDLLKEVDPGTIFCWGLNCACPHFESINCASIG